MQPPPMQHASYPRGDVGKKGPGVYFELIGDAFRMVFAKPKVYIPAGAVAVALFLVGYLGLIAYWVSLLPILQSTNQSQPQVTPEQITRLLEMYCVYIFFFYLMQIVSHGIEVCAIEDYTTGTTSFRSFILPVKKFVYVGITYFLVQLFVGIGMIFCFVPGIYLMGALSFAPTIVMAEDVGPFEAMRRSFEMTRDHVWMLALLLFVVTMVGGLGATVCIVGMAVTMPVRYIVVALHYARFTDMKPVNPNPAVPFAVPPGR